MFYYITACAICKWWGQKLLLELSNMAAWVISHSTFSLPIYLPLKKVSVWTQEQEILSSLVIDLLFSFISH